MESLRGLLALGAVLEASWAFFLLFRDVGAANVLKLLYWSLKIPAYLPHNPSNPLIAREDVPPEGVRVLRATERIDKHLHHLLPI